MYIANEKNCTTELVWSTSQRIELETYAFTAATLCECSFNMAIIRSYQINLQKINTVIIISVTYTKLPNISLVLLHMLLSDKFTIVVITGSVTRCLLLLLIHRLIR